MVYFLRCPNSHLLIDVLPYLWSDFLHLSLNFYFSSFLYVFMDRSYSNIGGLMEVVVLSVLEFHLLDHLHVICVIIVKWNLLVGTLHEHEFRSSKRSIETSDYTWAILMISISMGTSVATKRRILILLLIKSYFWTWCSTSSIFRIRLRRSGSSVLWPLRKSHRCDISGRNNEGFTWSINIIRNINRCLFQLSSWASLNRALMVSITFMGCDVSGMCTSNIRKHLVIDVVLNFWDVYGERILL
jgi:hypothetical protein